MKAQKSISPPLALAVAGIETGDTDIDSMLAIPIKRGVFNGISGNGRDLLHLRERCLQGSIDRRKYSINTEYMKTLQKKQTYFTCPMCGGTI